MSLHLSHCATSIVNNLDDLRKKRESESLRQYLISEACFPAHKDPHTAAITIEELKKLARAWKLNGKDKETRSNTFVNHVVAPFPP